MNATDMLRHTLAALAYRSGKVLRDVPAGFSTFRAAPGTRTPGEILAHVGDLFDWAIALARGEHKWHDSQPAAWDQDVARFYAGVAELDRILTAGGPAGCSCEQLFQGPVADALTHIGQIALLRRMAGSPVRAENYFKADIRLGRIGPEQSPPRVEFD
jgi:hypothetical protein